MKRGSYILSGRAATLTVFGTYSGRVMAPTLATSNANLMVVVTDNGAVVAKSEIFSRFGTAASWNYFSSRFAKSLSVTLWAGHEYCVYLHLKTSATAGIAGSSAGADVWSVGKYAGYVYIDISF